MSAIRKQKLMKLGLAIGLLVGAVVAVIFIFRQGIDLIHAAREASLVFLMLSVSLVIFMRPKSYGSLSALWTFNWAFLLIFVLPMFVFRWTSDGLFADFHWLGMTGPTLHSYSNYCYYLLLAGWVFDLGKELMPTLGSKEKGKVSAFP